MTSRQSTELTDRQARVAEIKRTQKRSERKRTVLIAAVAGVVVLGLTGATIAVMVNANQQTASVNAAARSPIEGVKTFTGLSRNHVEGKVTYAQNPPVGGDHSAVDENCGYYSQPVADENAVHSLEHGAVWITHDPNLPATSSPRCEPSRPRTATFW